MNDTQLKLLTIQSEFNKDCNTIIDLIAPIICNKKITKREIDKANKAIFAHFGEYNAYRTEAGELKLLAHYVLGLQAVYSSCTLKIYKGDRSIQDGERTYYIPDSDRTIYLEKDGTITPEVLQKYKHEAKYTPTEKQIVKAYEKTLAIDQKIRALQQERSELPFYYYFNQ